MKNLPKLFWFIFFISFILINENFVQWLLAVIIGEYSLISGFQDAYKYFTILGYIFFSAFRAIPYTILFLIIKENMRKNNRNISGAAWGGLFGILAFIIWGSWETLYTLYTDEHTSSTSAIAFLFIPIFSIISGFIGAAIGYGINKMINTYKKS